MGLPSVLKNMILFNEGQNYMGEVKSVTLPPLTHKIEEWRGGGMPGAVGIDMESATIAAQGYRFRVPYGTLLCVSDKPIHGELKLPGQANRFYEEAIAGHLRIGLMTCELLRQEGPKLHSRKLRAFNEPPFR